MYYILVYDISNVAQFSSICTLKQLCYNYAIKLYVGWSNLTAYLYYLLHNKITRE